LNYSTRLIKASSGFVVLLGGVNTQVWGYRSNSDSVTSR